MIFAPLVLMTILLGIYPALVLDIIGPTVTALVLQHDTALGGFDNAARLSLN